MEIWNHFPLKKEFFMPRPNMVQSETERRHKIGASASRYANIGANCESTKHDTIHMASLPFTTPQWIRPHVSIPDFSNGGDSDFPEAPVPYLRPHQVLAVLEILQIRPETQNLPGFSHSPERSFLHSHILYTKYVLSFSEFLHSLIIEHVFFSVHQKSE